MNEQDTSGILKVLVAADKLPLHELIDYLQTYLILFHPISMIFNFELIHQISFQSSYLLELQRFCTNLMAKFPEKIFQSLDFTPFPKKIHSSTHKKG